jgi:hypothetical protein
MIAIKKEPIDMTSTEEDKNSTINALHNEVIQYFILLSRYNLLFVDELFGSSETKRIDILNHATGSFFSFLQNLYEMELILGIARMTDSSQTMRKENLTIQRLPALVPDKQTSEKKKVQGLVDDAVEKAAFAKDWRNRFLAHRDLDFSIGGEDVVPLEQATMEKIEESLKSIAAVLHHFGYESPHGKIINGIGGEDTLLMILREGLIARHDRLEGLEKMPIDEYMKQEESFARRPLPKKVDAARV